MATIKLSKAQWEMIGTKAGWMKTAEDAEVKKGAWECPSCGRKSNSEEKVCQNKDCKGKEEQKSVTIGRPADKKPAAPFQKSKYVPGKSPLPIAAKAEAPIKK